MASTNVDQILKLCDEFTPSSPPEYFFDHNPETFAGFNIEIQIIYHCSQYLLSGVLEMYRSGQFHIPDGSRACASVMRRDFEYWGLDELNLEACCALKYYPEIDVCRIQKEKDKEEDAKMQQEAAEAVAVFGQGKVAKFRLEKESKENNGNT